MFYPNIFDPILVVSQIMLMQCSFYLAYGFWILLCNMIAGTDVDLASIFAPSAMDFGHSYGWPPIAACILAAPVSAISLMLVVGRSKKCLDFGVTVAVTHLIACAIYETFPTSSCWWIANVTYAVVAITMGEWLCIRSEMQDIPTHAMKLKPIKGTGTSVSLNV